MTFTLYTDSSIDVTGALPRLHIKALTSSGIEQNLTSGLQKRVRVYNSNEYIDFDMPAWIDGKPNLELAKAIAKAFPAKS